MACQTQIDNMLKKDFSISSNNLLYSHRLSMIKRKNELLNNVSNLFESLISEKEFKQIKHLISNPIRDNLTWRFVPQPEAFDHMFTDKELYEKYNLTEEEINIIESVIKERK